MPLGGQKKLNLIRGHYGGLHHNKKHAPVSMGKAKEILHHGEVRGHELTKKQRGLFGAIASGQKLRKA